MPGLGSLTQYPHQPTNWAGGIVPRSGHARVIRILGRVARLNLGLSVPIGHAGAQPTVFTTPRFRGQFAIDVTVYESTTLIDTTSSLIVGTASITESATSTDTSDAVSTRIASIAEAATATDLPSASAIFAVAISEAGTAGETTDAVTVRTAAIAEAVTAFDSVSSTLVMVATLAESLTAIDTSSTAGVEESTIIEAAFASESSDAHVVRFINSGGKRLKRKRDLVEELFLVGAL